jgi:chaperone required for assembly of F1-ATPase
MSRGMIGGWKARRFWSDVTTAATDGGFAVMLDTRRVMTPGKLPLILPTQAMADAAAAEWAAQGDEILPLTMPVTRAANSAIERVRPQRPEVAAMLAAYAETDLTCHRADAPAALVARQAEAWDPLLDWAADALGARLVPVAGIRDADQPHAARAAIADRLHALDEFRLTAMHDLVTLSGSVVIGLATALGRLHPDTAWSLSRIDEDWQAAQWGHDEEAAEAAAIKQAAFRGAARFWLLAGAD